MHELQGCAIAGVDAVATVRATLERDETLRMLVLGLPAAGKSCLFKRLHLELAAMAAKRRLFPIALPLVELVRFCAREGLQGDFVARHLAAKCEALGAAPSFAPWALRELRLGGNDLRGDVPAALGACARLETLWLERNAALAPPPASLLARLPRLRSLVVGGGGDASMGDADDEEDDAPAGGWMPCCAKK